MLIVIPCLEKMALCSPVCIIIKKRVPEIRSVVSSKNSEKAEFWESATSWGTVIALCTESFLFSESLQAGSGAASSEAPASSEVSAIVCTSGGCCKAVSSSVSPFACSDGKSSLSISMESSESIPPSFVAGGFGGFVEGLSAKPSS